jgi:hypothetical protein
VFAPIDLSENTMHVDRYEYVGCSKSYISYIFNHSFSGPPSSTNFVDGS